MTLIVGYVVYQIRRMVVRLPLKRWHHLFSAYTTMQCAPVLSPVKLGAYTRNAGNKWICRGGRAAARRIMRTGSNRDMNTQKGHGFLENTRNSMAFYRFYSLLSKTISLIFTTVLYYLLNRKLEKIHAIT